MSTPDSFVDEVTDAVRRDRLFAAFRKYGWIGVVIVLMIVGGAAWNEWQKATAAARAEGFGDAALAALDKSGADKVAALAALPADGDQMAVQALLEAANPETDKPGALAALDKLIADTTRPQVYRDIATLRRVAIAGADMALADRRTALQSVAVPGRAFRPLAEEQLAYLLIEAGKTDEALKALTGLIQDKEAPAGMRRRLGLVITALGGNVPDPVAVPQAVPVAVPQAVPADAG